ncbi:unnamed protein product [Ilex paraguariensis]|uniref:Uncharacterized protein n=1 Tax=Ilex paraguariensis TaxID=185542 RepID=A0ABC8S9F7_9AQUA
MEFGNAVEKELQKEGVWVPSTPVKPVEVRPGLESGNRGFLVQSGSPSRLQEAGNINATIATDKNKGLYNWEEAVLATRKAAAKSDFIDWNKRNYNVDDVLVGNQRTDNRNETYTCVGYCSSSGVLEGVKCGESTADVVEKSCFTVSGSLSCGFDECGAKLAGMDNTSFVEVLVLPDKSSLASETSEISTSEVVVDGMSSLPCPASDFETESSINTPRTLGKTDEIVHQQREKNEAPCSGNESNKLHVNENSQDNIESSSFTVLTPSEKQNARKRQNSGIDLNKKPRQRPSVRKHRPKVVVEGQPIKNPKSCPSKLSTLKPQTVKPSSRKPQTPKPLTPKPRTPKPSTPKLQTPKPSTLMHAISKRSPHKKKYMRKNSHEVLANTSEDADEQAFDMNPQYSTISCRRALNFNLENQVRDDDDVREIVNLNISPNEKQNCISKNCLKASAKPSEDVSQIVDQNPEDREKPCLQAQSCNLEKSCIDGKVVVQNPVHAEKLYWQTLNVNLEKHGRDEKDARKIVHQYQRRSKSVDKSLCNLDFNQNLESQEVGNDINNVKSKKGNKQMAGNLAGIAYGNTHAESCSQTDKSLAERVGATHQKDLCATSTTQTGCKYNSLHVYQRRSQRDQCLKYSRKLGPNFPRKYKKIRTRRRKATIPNAFWSIIAADDGQREVKAQKRKKVTVSLSTSRISKRISKKGLSQQLTQTTAAVEDPESFKGLLLGLSPLVKVKRKRSKGLRQRRNFVSPVANSATEEQTKAAIDEAELLKCALTLHQLKHLEGRHPRDLLEGTT